MRGFAVKFYTDEGNWDLVGNNTPGFFVRDPDKSQERARDDHFTIDGVESSADNER